MVVRRRLAATDFGVSHLMPAHSRRDCQELSGEDFTSFSGMSKEFRIQVELANGRS